MTDRFYPDLTESTLQPLNILRLLTAEDPNYLDHEECPYNEALKTGLREFLALSHSPLPANDTTTYSLDDLESESEKLYRRLQEFGDTSTGDATERNTYFRVSALLLERLISLKERVINLKMMHAFTKLVLQIMEDELPPDIRTSVIDRLKGQLAA